MRELAELHDKLVNKNEG